MALVQEWRPPVVADRAETRPASPAPAPAPPTDPPASQSVAPWNTTAPPPQPWQPAPEPEAPQELPKGYVVPGLQMPTGTMTTGGSFGARTVTPTASDEVADAAREQMTQNSRQRFKQQDLNARPSEVREMTRAEYMAMSPAQRMAVDFNTQLVQAAERDRAYTGNRRQGLQNEDYQTALSNVFGESSDRITRYAPETVALLEQIGYENKDARLSDFLNLRTAITDKDLESLIPTGTPVQTSVGTMTPALDLTPNSGRETQTDTIVNGMLNLKRNLQVEGQMLDTLRNSMINSREDMITRFGVTELAPFKARVGWGDGEADKGFKNAFDEMSKRANQADFDMYKEYTSKWLEAGGIPEEKWNRYVRERINQQEKMRDGLKPAETFFSPTELRTLFGIPQKGQSNG